MPSLRGRLFRFMVKRVVGARFRRAGTSVERLRGLTDFFVESQKVPADTEIDPVMVGDLAAEWVRAPGVRTDAVVLYLHGGGFVMGAPATHRELAARLSAAIGAPLLSLDYRLAPEHPFPAAMEDAVAAYRWLLAEGHVPDRLAIGGDSAGGSISLQALIRMRDERTALPAAALLMSPATDLRCEGESFTSMVGVDPLLTQEMCRFTASLYVADADPDTPLLSLPRADLTGLPPLCIHAGEHDLLLSDSLRLAERARACGVEVELRTFPGMWHVFQAAARFVPEARASIEGMGRFVAARLG
ncbi:MAG: alpha/beta hydrolase [Planctomycetota bacterium]|jgi:acetyl esterase/lipase